MIDNSKSHLRIVEISSNTSKTQPVMDSTIRQIYDLLGSNMTSIIPATELDWRSDEKYKRWKNEVFQKGLKEGTRYILLFDNRGLRGFLSFTVSSEGRDIYLNEFQIQPYARADSVTFKVLTFPKIAFHADIVIIRI